MFIAFCPLKASSKRVTRAILTRSSGRDRQFQIDRVVHMDAEVTDEMVQPVNKAWEERVATQKGSNSSFLSPETHQLLTEYLAHREGWLPSKDAKDFNELKSKQKKRDRYLVRKAVDGSFILYERQEATDEEEDAVPLDRMKLCSHQGRAARDVLQLHLASSHGAMPGIYEAVKNVYGYTIPKEFVKLLCRSFARIAT